jgi:hypothetical protein
MNGGWIQFAGPISRVRDWKTIETTQFNQALQQVRYRPPGQLFTRPGPGAPDHAPRRGLQRPGAELAL